MSENGAITWANGRRKLRDLIPWDHNPREINTREAERLGDSLVEFGQIQTIAIGPDNEVYDGHQRKLVWSILPQFGRDYEVDVRVSSRPLTEHERQKLVVYLHKGTTGEWDWAELANSFELSDLTEWGLEEGELIGWPQEEPAEDPGAQLDKAAELQEKWGVARGDIWIIESVATPGKFHRVMCGDSTSAEDVGRLMGGERAAMVWSDPPYGKGGYAGRGGKLDAVAGDDADDETIRRFFGVGEAPEKYVCCDWETYHHLLAARGSPRSLIVWAKPSFGMGNGYRRQHEFIGYYGGFQSTQETDLWQVGRDGGYKHPTQKPVELPSRAIVNSTDLGECVLDTFCGVGGCLVACEQTGRVGFGCEIEPKYVSVTLERLAGMGLEPQRVTQ